MYHAMTSLGFASDSGYKGPIKLEGDPKGASILILGAGLAGMTAALELRKAGYKVQILEFNNRPGGRNWTLRGGDSFTELGGFKQTCEFEQGLYFNPGSWRQVASHPTAGLDLLKRWLDRQQMSDACGQRGWRWQPRGGLNGLGTSPSRI
jgi:monoamine oxidase